eukprot:CAMPEP_0196573990 /NCGR_PEP_ID=MMETSP1081-20130531/3795_1 /TAXON_ID=36882 /ORGANISM="Pyramimonas amylifera, Strain CCMP720" /LENGTH=208 /DNA_ID=CAMNT_0041891873 /DNA_START=277 /DNA_END=903 /DNA_ORIENTATION=+
MASIVCPLGLAKHCALHMRGEDRSSRSKSVYHLCAPKQGVVRSGLKVQCSLASRGREKAPRPSNLKSLASKGEDLFPESDPLGLHEQENLELPGWVQQAMGPQVVALVPLALCLLLSLDAEAARAEGGNQTYTLAEGEDFWSNMGRYMKYGVTVVFGTGYVLVKPLFQYLKNPKTAIPLILVVIGVVLIIRWTLQTMLGLNDPETMGY